MASKGKAPAKASSTRVHGSTSQQQSPLEIQLYETPAHEKRGKILEERRALHERTIKFPKGEDTFEERIMARGWGFMYEPSIPINLSWVREFYANKTKKDQREIFLRGRKITCSVSTIKKTLGIPKFRGKCRPKKKILNYEAWMWLKLVVCNINPTYFEHGGSSLDLCPYEGYAGLSCFGHEICHECHPTETKTHLLIFPMFITKWVRDNNVPRFPGDVMWREDDEEVAPPVPPPAAPVDVPAPSAPSSPEPSRKELMRTLWRNEHIMRRHEQLMLMLHPGLDTSGLEQISFPDISQNSQSQRAGSAEKGNAEEDDDFQSAEATGDANAYAGEESANDE
ncbi:hypothetical protein PIB30_067745 [Stylosanthes scabra]|uniref:Putative plant transposon protein domain-containing protein n=1 Tax=Stylosanthes scabra TaxID=79078 RepID=A0ABU6XP37_9FABA|nr:hypothetical protein [Stylosanthes scabra]